MARKGEADALLSECFRQFTEKISSCSDDSRSVIAMDTMLQYINKDNSSTMQEILVRMQKLRAMLVHSPSSTPGISSSLELILKVTCRGTDVLELAGDLAELRKVMADRINGIIREMKEGIKRVGRSAMAGLQEEGNVIVTRGWSAALVELCSQAINEDIIIQKVYILHGQDNSRSLQLQRSLLSLGLDAELIPDACAAFVMQKSNLLVVDCDSISSGGGVFVEFGMLSHMIVAQSLHVNVLALGSMFKLTAESPVDTHFYARDRKLPDGSHGVFPHIEFCPPRFVGQVFTETGTLSPGTFRHLRQNVFA